MWTPFTGRRRGKGEKGESAEWILHQFQWRGWWWRRLVATMIIFCYYYVSIIKINAATSFSKGQQKQSKTVNCWWKGTTYLAIFRRKQPGLLISVSAFQLHCSAIPSLFLQLQLSAHFDVSVNKKLFTLESMWS